MAVRGRGIGCATPPLTAPAARRRPSAGQASPRGGRRTSYGAHPVLRDGDVDVGRQFVLGEHEAVAWAQRRGAIEGAGARTAAGSASRRSAGTMTPAPAARNALTRVSVVSAPDLATPRRRARRPGPGPLATTTANPPGAQYKRRVASDAVAGRSTEGTSAGAVSSPGPGPQDR
ncbi:hypothetical protein [[Actinomadura] parvosata]|uniref:hypothetical protein n=1 Tax=[Actinomadura] parvosata TaxID=1955412 RepID=UPI00164447BE